MSITLETFHTLAQVRQFAIHPDGQVAVVSVAKLSEDGSKRTAELWKLPLHAAGEPCLLHSDEQGATSPRFDAKGCLYFLSKAKTENDEAHEFQQIWRLSERGPATPCTDEPLGVHDFRITEHGLIALCPVLRDNEAGAMRAIARDRKSSGPSYKRYQRMPVRLWDRWLGGDSLHFIKLDRDGGSRVDLTPAFDHELDNDHGLAWDLRADGKALATVCKRPGLDRLEDSSILVIELESGEHRHLGVDDRVTHHSLRFSPDGRHIAATRSQREWASEGRKQVIVYPSAGGQARVLAPSWQAVPTVEAWQGHEALLLCAPARGDMGLFRVRLADDAVEQLIGGASCAAIQTRGEYIYGLVHSFSSPPELFCMHLEGDGQRRPVSALSGIPEHELDVHRKSCIGAGGTSVDYFFLRDPSWGDEPRPTLLWIHGGPMSSWTEGWHWRWNPLPFIAAGYQVALPNPRGSTGYGHQFLEEICNNEWGAACYLDLMAVSDDLCADPLVDDTRIAAMGGSFGGYMSNWIGTQSDRFAAIITHASVYRFSAFHGTTDFPAFWALHMGMHPSDDEALYNRYSPHLHVDNWKTPVLITHGEKDYRVPISESLMLFEDLQRRGVSATLLVYPDENHWILKPRNSRHWYESCLAFLADEVGANRRDG